MTAKVTKTNIQLQKQTVLRYKTYVVTVRSTTSTTTENTPKGVFSFDVCNST